MKTPVIAYFIFAFFSLAACSKPQEEGPKLPVVKTLNYTALSHEAVKVTGWIETAGTAPVSGEGICYGTVPSPTIDSPHIGTALTDTFTAVVGKLKPLTQYYFRAYALNAAGIAYGNELSFKTPQDPDLIDPSETIYISGGRLNGLIAMDALTGTIKWRVTINNNGCASPIFTANKVIVQDPDNNLYAFDQNGKAQWMTTLSGTLLNIYSLAPDAPLAHNGVIFTKTIDYVSAVEAATGKIIWEFNAPGAIDLANTPFFYDNNTIYLLSGYTFYAIDAITGKQKWSNHRPEQGIPMITGNRIYALGLNYNIDVIDALDGSLIWSSPQTPALMNSAQINVGYSRIFVVEGAVLDSATATINYPPLEAVNSWAGTQPDGLSPILEDSLAITTSAIHNPFTGKVITRLPAVRVIGCSYANHVVYYETDVYERPDNALGRHYYCDVAALDVRTGTLLWSQAIENAFFYDVEPCIVSKSGICRRGGFVFN